MNKEALVHLFHIIIVGSIFLYVGIQKTNIPKKLFSVLFGLGIVVVLYHMYKAYNYFIKNKNKISNSTIVEKLNLCKNDYIVVSAHREENIDLKDNFNTLTIAINKVAEKYKKPIIFSTHPRTKKKIEHLGIKFHPLITNIEPLGFFDYISLQMNSFIVLSDSGTISEESAMLGFDALSIRTSTERPEAIDAGTIVLGGIDTESIINAIELVKLTTVNNTNKFKKIPWEYEIENTSEIVIRIIKSYTNIINKVIWDK
jgi:UDP-N-acetylglucosamine 2-epimerase (non-hydrolysing)